MQYIKRVGLFLAVNILAVMTITFVLDLIGFTPYLTSQGIDVTQLALFCFIWGMVGSLISLFSSKAAAKRGMGLMIVNGNTPQPAAKKVYQIVEELARKADLPKTPEVALWNSDVVNAFATGPSSSNALVAVSSGLINTMSENDLRGVIGHEISHIKNGDMVTMGLLQGIVNAFVMFIARILASVLIRSRSNDSYQGYSGFTQMLQFVLMLLGSIVVSWFSRTREFRADEGGAKLAGREVMINALKKLKEGERRASNTPTSASELQFQCMMISSISKLAYLFASHPPIEQRIAHLQEVEIR